MQKQINRWRAQVAARFLLLHRVGRVLLATCLLLSVAAISADSADSPDLTADSTDKTLSKTLSTDALAKSNVAEDATSTLDKSLLTPTPLSHNILYSHYLKNADYYRNIGQVGSFVVSRPRNDFISAVGQQVGDTLWKQFENADTRRHLLDAFNPNIRSTATEEYRDLLFRGGWQLTDIFLDQAVKSATEEARRSGFIRNVGVDLQTELGTRFSNIGIDIVGALRETHDEAVAWQLRGYRGSSKSEVGGNAGLIYRRAVSNSNLIGVNTFVDYQGHDRGDFWRWGGGGEFRSAWAGVFANYYDAITSPIYWYDSNDTRQVTYSADGVDVELNVHSPDVPWFILAASYYSYRGDFAGSRREEGMRYGVRFTPSSIPARVEVDYELQDGKGNVGGSFSYLHNFGKKVGGSSAVNGSTFRAQDYFFAPVNREYTQRIFSHEAPEPPPVVVLWGVEYLARNTEVKMTYPVKEEMQVTVIDRQQTTVNISSNVTAEITVSPSGSASLSFRFPVGGNVQNPDIATLSLSGGVQVLGRVLKLENGTMLDVHDSPENSGLAIETPQITLRTLGQGRDANVGARLRVSLSADGTEVSVQIFNGQIRVWRNGETKVIGCYIDDNEIEGIEIERLCALTSSDVKYAVNYAFPVVVTGVGINGEDAYGDDPHERLLGVEMLSSTRPGDEAGRVQLLAGGNIQNPDDLWTYIDDTPLASITFGGATSANSGEGVLVREVFNTGGLRMSLKGDNEAIFYLDRTVLTTYANRVAPYQETLRFEVFSPVNPHLQVREDAVRVEVEVGRYFGRVRPILRSVNNGEVAGELAHDNVLLRVGAPNALNLTVATLSVAGGTGSNNIEVVASNVDGVILTLSNGIIRFNQQPAVSDLRYTVSLVFDDTGLFSRVTDTPNKTTLILTVQYLEPLRDLEFSVLSTTRAAVVDIGGTMLTNYHFVRPQSASYDLQYPIYNGPNRVAIGDVRTASLSLQVQYAGGSDRALVSLILQDNEDIFAGGLETSFTFPRNPSSQTIVYRMSSHIANGAIYPDYPASVQAVYVVRVTDPELPPSIRVLESKYTVNLVGNYRSNLDFDTSAKSFAVGAEIEVSGQKVRIDESSAGEANPVVGAARTNRYQYQYAETDTTEYVLTVSVNGGFSNGLIERVSITGDVIATLNNVFAQLQYAESFNYYLVDFADSTPMLGGLSIAADGVMYWADAPTVSGDVDIVVAGNAKDGSGVSTLTIFANIQDTIDPISLRFNNFERDTDYATDCHPTASPTFNQPVGRLVACGRITGNYGFMSGGSTFRNVDSYAGYSSWGYGSGLSNYRFRFSGNSRAVPASATAPVSVIGGVKHLLNRRDTAVGLGISRNAIRGVHSKSLLYHWTAYNTTENGRLSLRVRNGGGFFRALSAGEVAYPFAPHGSFSYDPTSFPKQVAVWYDADRVSTFLRGSVMVNVSPEFDIYYQHSANSAPVLLSTHRENYAIVPPAQVGYVNSHGNLKSGYDFDTTVAVAATGPGAQNVQFDIPLKPFATFTANSSIITLSVIEESGLSTTDSFTVEYLTPSREHVLRYEESTSPGLYRATVVMHGEANNGLWTSEVLVTGTINFRVTPQSEGIYVNFYLNKNDGGARGQGSLTRVLLTSGITTPLPTLEIEEDFYYNGATNCDTNYICEPTILASLEIFARNGASVDISTVDISLKSLHPNRLAITLSNNFLVLDNASVLDGTNPHSQAIIFLGYGLSASVEVSLQNGFTGITLYRQTDSSRTGSNPNAYKTTSGIYPATLGISENGRTLHVADITVSDADYVSTYNAVRAASGIPAAYTVRQDYRFTNVMFQDHYWFTVIYDPEDRFYHANRDFQVRCAASDSAPVGACRDVFLDTPTRRLLYAPTIPPQSIARDFTLSVVVAMTRNGRNLPEFFNATTEIRVAAPANVAASFGVQQSLVVRYITLTAEAELAGGGDTATQLAGDVSSVGSGADRALAYSGLLSSYRYTTLSIIYVNQSVAKPYLGRIAVSGGRGAYSVTALVNNAMPQSQLIEEVTESGRLIGFDLFGYWDNTTLEPQYINYLLQDDGGINRFPIQVQYASALPTFPTTLTIKTSGAARVVNSTTKSSLSTDPVISVVAPLTYGGYMDAGTLSWLQFESVTLSVYQSSNPGVQLSVIATNNAPLQPNTWQLAGRFEELGVHHFTVSFDGMSSGSAVRATFVLRYEVRDLAQPLAFSNAPADIYTGTGSKQSPLRFVSPVGTGQYVTVLATVNFPAGAGITVYDIGHSWFANGASPPNDISVVAFPTDNNGRVVLSAYLPANGQTTLVQFAVAGPNNVYEPLEYYVTHQHLDASEYRMAASPSILRWGQVGEGEAVVTDAEMRATTLRFYRNGFEQNNVGFRYIGCQEVGNFGGIDKVGGAGGKGYPEFIEGQGACRLFPSSRIQVTRDGGGTAATVVNINAMAEAKVAGQSFAVDLLFEPINPPTASNVQDDGWYVPLRVFVGVNMSIDVLDPDSNTVLPDNSIYQGYFSRDGTFGLDTAATYTVATLNVAGGGGSIRVFSSATPGDNIAKFGVTDSGQVLITTAGLGGTLTLGFEDEDPGTGNQLVILTLRGLGVNLDPVARVHMTGVVLTANSDGDTTPRTAPTYPITSRFLDGTFSSVVLTFDRWGVAYSNPNVAGAIAASTPSAGLTDNNYVMTDASEYAKAEVNGNDIINYSLPSNLKPIDEEIAVNANNSESGMIVAYYGSQPRLRIPFTLVATRETDFTVGLASTVSQVNANALVDNRHLLSTQESLFPFNFYLTLTNLFYDGGEVLGPGIYQELREVINGREVESPDGRFLIPTDQRGWMATLSGGATVGYNSNVTYRNHFLSPGLYTLVGIFGSSDKPYLLNRPNGRIEAVKQTIVMTLTKLASEIYFASTNRDMSLAASDVDATVKSEVNSTSSQTQLRRGYDGIGGFDSSIVSATVMHASINFSNSGDVHRNYPNMDITLVGNLNNNNFAQFSVRATQQIRCFRTVTPLVPVTDRLVYNITDLGTPRPQTLDLVSMVPQNPTYVRTPIFPHTLNNTPATIQWQDNNGYRGTLEIQSDLVINPPDTVAVVNYDGNTVPTYTRVYWDRSARFSVPSLGINNFSVTSGFTNNPPGVALTQAQINMVRDAITAAARRTETNSTMGVTAPNAGNCVNYADGATKQTQG